MNIVRQAVLVLFAVTLPVAARAGISPSYSTMLTPSLVTEIADGIAFPPPDPSAPPFSEESVQDIVDLQLQQRVAASQDGSTGFVTVQSAKDSGWGVVADHFAEIDRDRDGRASFAEISAFFDARSPLPKAQARSANTTIQQIE